VHPDVFDAIADSLGMTGKGRDAAKDVLTAEVGTLSAAARRHDISRPAVARQVKRIQAAAEDGHVEVTLSLSLAELEALFSQRDTGCPPAHPTADSIVARAERQLHQALGAARASTKGAAFFGSTDRLLIIDRQRHTAIHAWIYVTPSPDGFEHQEVELLSSGRIADGVCPPAYDALRRQTLVTDNNGVWWYLRIHSLTGLDHLLGRVSQ